MSDETIKKTDDNVRAENDWLVQHLVTIANFGELGIDVTLQFGGMLVSGTIIGGKKYFDLFAEDFARPFSAVPETAEQVKGGFAKFGNVYSTTEQDDNNNPPQFIHLRGAKFFTSSGRPIQNDKNPSNLLWRGRICEVSGFFLGSIDFKEAT